MPPAQAGEATVISIRSDPLAPALYRQGREIRVRYEIPFRAHFQAQAAKDRPMSRAGVHANAVRRLAQLIRKRERGRNGARLVKDLGVGGNADEPAQRELGNAVRLVAVDHVFQPGAISGMIRRVFPVRVDQDVDVGEDQFRIP